VRKSNRTKKAVLARVGLAMMAFAIVGAAGLPAYAISTPIYYDGGIIPILTNGNSAASAISGNWNTGLLNWDAGPVPHVGWNNGNNDIAFFSAGTAFAAPTPGTVTLTSGITVGGIVFNTSGYTITGNTLNLGGTNNTIALNNLVTAATINSAIAGNANMTFTAQNPTGAATLTLGTAGGWTGSTTVDAGLTLQLNSASTALLNTTGITLNGGTIIQNATANANRISDSAAINSFGGTIATNNTSGANVYNEIIGAVTLNSGLTTFVHNANQVGIGTQTLTLSGLTRTGATNTSAVNFAANSGLNGTKNFIAVTGAGSTTAGQIIGPWATTGNTAGANDYAIYSSDQVAPANIAGTVETAWTTPTDAFTNALAAQTLTGTRTITALRNTGATATLTLASGANLETYGVLNGATTLFTVAPGTGGVLTTPTGGGYLHLNAGNGTTGGTMTITAPVTNNGGTVAVVKNGAGILNLNGNNTFTGGIQVNSGTVSVLGTNTFATGAAGADVINGGALTYANIASWGGAGRSVTFNGTGTLTSTVDGYIGGTLTSNDDANGVINGGNISFGTTTGDGTLIYSTASNRLLNLGNASTFTGDLQARLTNNANYTPLRRFNSPALATALTQPFSLSAAHRIVIKLSPSHSMAPAR